MSSTHRRTLTALGLALCAVGVQAQGTKLSPGLWEMSMEMKSGGAEMDAGMAKMQAELARMPPEQRKQIEAMMAQRGMALGAGGKGVGVKVCISKERAERGDLPEEKNDRGCKRESIERSGSTTKFKLVCTNPPSTGSGEFTFKSDKAFTGKMIFDSERNGKPQHMEMQQQGQWLSADCGTLQPR